MDFSQGLGFGGLGSMVPITPIIYGNGTMLSDIGEVTEAESTVGGPGGIGARRLQSRLAKSGNTTVSSSPTLPPYHNVLMAKKKAQAHKRSVSDESASTFTTEAPHTNNHFRDFDDTVSVDESAFAGDDEESVVDYSYTEPQVAETRTLYSNRASRMIDLKKEEEELSSAALSRRAETILANAKKRLDNMEGNLNRARNSLIITPSTSIHSSSPLARSTPSPPAARIVAQLGNQPLRHRQLGHSTLLSNHSRISSENSIPSPIMPVPVSRTFLSGRPLDPSPRISAPVPVRQDSSDSYASAPRRSYSALQSRNSDPSTVTATTNQEGGSGSDGDIFNGHRSDRYVRAATAEPSYHHEIQHNGLERSASTTDMHDLTGKMQDLKTKISSLRDKAREDMRRRSAQNLRTPSPFTAAEQWYTSSNDYRDGHLSANAVIAHNPWDKDSPVDGESPKDVLIAQNGQVNHEVFEDYEPSEAATIYHEIEEVESNPSETYGNVMTSFGDADPLNKLGNKSDSEDSSGHDREQDYAVDDDNESVYHDTFQAPMPSHEDREDAFDYEHFFLHSAMGTMSRERMARRDSQGSFSSEDSVETTKGLEPATEDYRDHLKIDPRGHHQRQQSADTLSTMASFATAQETFHDDDDEEDIINQYEEAEPFPVIPLEQLQNTKQSAFSNNQDAGRQTPQVVSRPTSVLSRPTSVLRNGVRQPQSVHRPSFSSHASTSSGTTRSKPKTPTNGTSTAPSSPAQPILDENGNELCGVALTTEDDEPPKVLPMSPVTMLRRDEQILVERLMASMNKCVIALQDSREGTVEHRLWRRRLDAARRVLEGIEGAV